MKCGNYLTINWIILLLLASSTTAYTANYYVSQSGSGAKNGTSVENAWARWETIDWDTDGSGPDTGVGGGDTLYVIGTVKQNYGFDIKGYGLSIGQKLTIASYSPNPGKLWVGREIDDIGWTGPDAYGAYNKSFTWSGGIFATEWTTDPWNGINLTEMSGVPDATWTGTGLFYNDTVHQLIYYKPNVGNPIGKTLSTYTYTTRVLEIYSKDYITLSGLKFNGPIKIDNSVDYFTLENCEIYCAGAKQFGVWIGGSGASGCHYGTIKNSTIHDCSTGIYVINQSYGDTANNNYWTIENNYIYNISGSSDSHGIGVQGGTGSILQYNNIYNAGTGITFWNQKTQSVRDNIVRFNKVNHMGYYGDGNGNGRGIEFSGETGDSDLTTGNLIYGNIVSDCTSDGNPDGVGIRSKMGIPTSGYSLKIFNNTVSNCAISYLIMATNYENYEIGAYLHNNISINPKTNGFHILVLNSGVTYKMSLAKNIYFGTGKFSYKGATNSTLADWKTMIAPQDVDSIDTDPKLNSLFIPQAGGSSINTGEDLSSLATLGLHPSSIFPTGVNNGNVITATQSAHGSGWEIGAFIYIEPLQAPQQLRIR